MKRSSVSWFSELASGEWKLCANDGRVVSVHVCGMSALWLTVPIWPLERSWLTVLATDGFSATFSTRGMLSRAERMPKRGKKLVSAHIHGALVGRQEKPSKLIAVMTPVCDGDAVPRTKAVDDMTRSRRRTRSGFHGE